MGSGEMGRGCGIVGERDGEDDDEEEDMLKAPSAWTASPDSSASLLRFWALIARGVGAGVIGAPNGDGRSSCSSWGLERFRELALRGCLGLRLVDGDRVTAGGGVASCLALRRTDGRGRGDSGVLGMYCTAIKRKIRHGLGRLGADADMRCECSTQRMWSLFPTPYSTTCCALFVSISYTA
jgi:hypothetical protein